MNYKFSLRGPDRVSEELATVLSAKRTIEFKDLFDLVHANLRAKDFARGGEEMLRLRSHEKLQAFVAAGFVIRDAKKYTGIPKLLKAFLTTAAEFNARFAAGTHTHPRPASQGLASPTIAPATKVNSAKVKKPIKKTKAVKKKTVQTR